MSKTVVQNKKSLRTSVNLTSFFFERELLRDSATAYTAKIYHSGLRNGKKVSASVA
jgi:hypothetical protein